MKFLIDNALSPVLSNLLKESGHDSKHVRDFGYILKTRKAKKPSFILFRKGSALEPTIINSDILKIIEKFTYDLESGSIIVIEDEKIRIRKLPILG
jgi:predicted nuclease of predicted toxin-antitoxin system